MIGEVTDGIAWGSNQKAAAAIRRRANELREEGYAIYRDERVTLSGIKSYYLFAFDRNEEFDGIKPRNPDTHPLGRRLNIRTAHIGMRVAVETMPDQIHPHHGRRGTIKGLNLTDKGFASAKVKFDDRINKVTLPVELLRQVAK